MNKSTVYRALKRLEDDEIIHAFIDGDGLKCYAKIEIHIKKRFILIFIKILWYFNLCTL